MLEVLACCWAVLILGLVVWFIVEQLRSLRVTQKLSDEIQAQIDAIDVNWGAEFGRRKAP